MWSPPCHSSPRLWSIVQRPFSEDGRVFSARLIGTTSKITVQRKRKSGGTTSRSCVLGSPCLSNSQFLLLNAFDWSSVWLKRNGLGFHCPFLFFNGV